MGLSSNSRHSYRAICPSVFLTNLKMWCSFQFGNLHRYLSIQHTGRRSVWLRYIFPHAHICMHLPLAFHNESSMSGLNGETKFIFLLQFQAAQICVIYVHVQLCSPKSNYILRPTANILWFTLQHEYITFSVCYFMRTPPKSSKMAIKKRSEVMAVH